MRVVYITPSFYPALSYGGPSRSSYELCRALGRQDCRVRVLTTDADGLQRTLDVPKDREVDISPGVRVRYCPRIARHSVSPRLLARLPHAIGQADVVHLQAVYSFPTIPSLAALRTLDTPVVWTPRGAFQRWEGTTRFHLKAAWEAVCRATKPRRLALHVTSEAEARDSISRMGPLPLEIIPNGVVPIEGARPRPFNPEAEPLRLLYLGRLHPIKGIDRLLVACHRLGPGLDWRLVIAGSGDNAHCEAVQAQVEELRLRSRICFAGFVDGSQKEQLFREAHLVVVPSHSENFGIVIAEALAHAVPVIASTGTPWSRLPAEHCGLWVDNDPESLAEAIRQAARMPLDEMGLRGRDWVAAEFSWDRVARRMVSLYERVRSLGRSAS